MPSRSNFQHDCIKQWHYVTPYLYSLIALLYQKEYGSVTFLWFHRVKQLQACSSYIKPMQPFLTIESLIAKPLTESQIQLRLK